MLGLVDRVADLCDRLIRHALSKRAINQTKSLRVLAEQLDRARGV